MSDEKQKSKEVEDKELDKVSGGIMRDGVHVDANRKKDDAGGHVHTDIERG
jgi:bacteriocin-like protein